MKLKTKVVMRWCLPIIAAGIILLSLAQPAAGMTLAASSTPTVQSNLPGKTESQPNSMSKIKVDGALLQTLSNGSSDFEIIMAEQADLSAAYSMDWQARGQYVYDTLRQTAERTQKSTIEYLKSNGFKFQSFINGNEIYVYGGSLSAVTTLEAMPEVGEIRAPVSVTLDEPVLKLMGPFPAAVAGAIDWGITDSKADQFWTTFNKAGEGILVANIDTGVQYDHPALANAYKCKNSANKADPSCWLDALNVCPTNAPCDNAGHGTHTMGTMVGSNDPTLQYTVGMAPGAQWIACKACATATNLSTCDDAALNTCADWILAPGGNPNNRPDVVNNSWGGGSGNTWYQAKVQAWQAAGIFPAFSAGNAASGSATCGSLSDPGDYPEAFASAAHNISRTHAYFSDMGPPSPLLGVQPYTKPNISAPGVSITSSMPGSSWGILSGTSMASPHSAGAAALLLSCNPALKGQVGLIFKFLQNYADSPTTAGTCGVSPAGQANYTFGSGYLDVLAAGEAACAGGTLSGTVTSGQGVIADAKITITSASVPGLVSKATTDASGVYTIALAAGTYHVTADKNGYKTGAADGVIINLNAATSLNFNIDPASPVMVSGKVFDASNNGYPLFARISITSADYSGLVFTSLTDGSYQVSLYQGVAYDFLTQAFYPGYLDAKNLGVVFSNGAATQDFGLAVDAASCKAPGYVKTTALSQNFDSVTPPLLPANWSTVVTSAGKMAAWATVTNSIFPANTPHSSPHQVYFNSHDAPSGDSARLQDNVPIDMTVLSNRTLTFWMYHDNSLDASFNDRVQPQVSTNGVDWINVGAEIPRYSATNQWVQHSIDLSAYASDTSLWIGLNGISNWGTDINIDDIVVGASCLPTGTMGFPTWLPVITNNP